MSVGEMEKRRPRKTRPPLDPIRGKTTEDRLRAYANLRLISAIEALAVLALILGVWSAFVMDKPRDRVLSAAAAIVGVVALGFVVRYYRRPVDPRQVREVRTLWDRIRRQ